MSEKNKAWCNLNNFPCIHPNPDDLENCIYCENYSFRKYIEYKRKGSKYEKYKNKN